MLEIFGRQVGRDELHRYLSTMSHVAGIQRSTLSEGRADGVEVVDIRTGSGFEFTAVPGRALDIVSATFRGTPLHWTASPGLVHPSYYEPNGVEWLRGYAGGLLTTGGLVSMGNPSVDAGEAHGLHGRVSYLPSQHISINSGWIEDTYEISLRGEVIESTALGTHLALTRQISTALGSSRFSIVDVVENRSSQPTPHMILYHFNFGYPFLTPDSRLLMSSELVDEDEEPVTNPNALHWSAFAKPMPDSAPQLLYHRPKPDANGLAHVALVNNGQKDPLGVSITYDTLTLPWLINWKMLREGDYVTGIEPANALVGGRAEERRHGRLRILQPRERVQYRIDFGVLNGFDEIDSFAAQHDLPARIS